MAKYSYITDKTHNNRKIQVESAKRDGSGKNIENNYAKQNGNYQSLTAGLSNNFDTKKVMVDESAYNFRPTATMGSVELEVGSPCKVKKIIGGSVAYNQLVNFDNDVQSTSWGGVGTYSITSHKITVVVNASESTISAGIVNLNFKGIAGHKYLAMSNENIRPLGFFLYDNVSLQQIAINNITNITSDTTNTFRLNFYKSGGLDEQVTYSFYLTCFDLTQMFGSTIADYIYSLEQANAGSGVAWFKRYFPKEYYAYNSGELVSVKTQGKKITHFNQFNKENATIGKYVNPLNGELVDNADYCASDYIRVVGGATYYLREINASGSSEYASCYDADKNYLSALYIPINGTIQIPTNAVYIRTTCSKSAIDSVNLNFHYDGERDGEYEPYNSETYPCDDIELRGIPQLDENNNLAFDGDEYANDGNVARKYGIVDLGTLEWGYDTTNKRFYSPSLTDAHFPNSAYENVNILCEKYTMDAYAYVNGNSQDKCIGGWYYEGTDYLDICDNSYNGVVEDFVSSLNGVYLVYELATPTDENSIPFTEVQECDNWGTEEWLAPTTDTRPCEVPVGHETDYLSNLKAKLEVAPNTPNENGVYVMEHNASGNSYTPIATWLTDNGYAKADTLPTKDSVGGTLRQLLSVKESLDFDDTDFVDLGSLEWSGGGVDANFYSSQVLPNTGVAYKSVCTKYIYNQGAYAKNSMADKSIGFATDGRIYCRDDNYADGNSLKQALKGVLLAYEKAS